MLETDSTLVELIELVKEEDAATIAEDDEMYDRIQRILAHIKSDFVDDLGNLIILEGGLNRSIQNRRFALKLRAYHEEHPEDIQNAVNEFFSLDNPDLTQSKVDALIGLDIPSGYDDTDPSLGSLEDEFNGWWHIDRMAERKTAVVSLILESLVYDIDEKEYTDEFDDLLESPKELKQLVIDDLKKRSEQAI